MATITTRAGKGSPLTNTEVDDNFSNLNSAKYESGATPTFGNVTASGYLALGQTTSFPTTGFISHTNGYLYGEGGSNGIILRSASGTTQLMFLTAAEVVVNNDSLDMDFRVESNDSTHMLFVDASTNRVGIGESAPATFLDLGFTTTDQTEGMQIHNKQYGGYGSTINFVSRTAASLSGGSDRTAARIRTIGANNWASDGNVESLLRFEAVEDNVLRNLLELNPASESVFNQGSMDMDFRVESNDSTHMLFVDAFNNHVGVDWATPNVPLDVNGVISSRPHGSGAAYSHGLLEISTNASNPQVKITTNILWSGGATHAYTVKISGFRYGSAQTCEVVICWHKYNNSFYSRTASSSGGFAPDITLAVENNKVVIHLGTVGYWPKLYVESMYNAYGGTGQAKGWSWSDAAISADANTPTETVSYKTDLGGDNLIGTAGAVFNDGSADADFRVESDSNANMLFVDAGANKVGVGTNGPGAVFEVYQAGTNANGIAQIYQNAATNYPTLYVKQRGEGGNSNDRQGLMIDVAGQNGGVGKMIATLTTNSNINSGVAFEPFTLWNAGTFQFRLGGTINENGQNSDFRVESDGHSHMLWVDASRNGVGVGTSSVFEHQQGAAIDMSYDGTVWAGNTYWAGGLKTGVTFYTTTAGDKFKHSNRQAVQHYQNSQGGSHHFYSAGGGTAGAVIAWQELAEFDRDEVVFNNGAADQNFRVESAGNPNILFVDAGNNRVNIGSSTNIGGLFNVAGTMKMMNTSNKVTSAMRPSGWGYSQGAYGVTIIGGDSDTGGTVSIGFDPSVNPSGAFSGYGQEMIFNKDISFYQSNAANDAWVRQIRMEKSTGIIFNDNSLSDIDFRVESNTKNEMLMVDAGNDVVNINSTQTTHQMGGGYRNDGLLRDFKRDEAVATFNEAATSSTSARTRRLVIPLYNYGPVEITIINGGHKYNNGGHFGTRVTKFYVAIEGTALRINTRRDIMQQGVNDYGVPVLTAHSTATLRIDWTVSAQVTCSTHVRVVGYGANGVTSCTTI